MTIATGPMFELRLAASLNEIKLQYRAKSVSVNAWHDISRIYDWTDWFDVPTVSITNEKK